MIKSFALAIALALLAMPQDRARADDYAKGIKAFEARNFNEARKVFLALAKLGDARAQYRIGAMYDLGIGGAADHATAFEWYLKSAAGDNADAQYALGEHLMTARDQHSNPAEAIAWYRKSAAHGRLQAFLMLAISYRDGAGVPKDLVLAHVFASIHVRAWGKMDLAERDKLSKELAAILTEEQRAESEELQLQGMADLKQLPMASKSGQMQGN
jgi:TPR repeat protein